MTKNKDLNKYVQLSIPTTFILHHVISKLDTQSYFIDERKYGY
jgi:hypothetical protein